VEASPAQHSHAHGFEHEALLYAGDEEFVERTSAFVREGLETEEPVLVMVGSAKIDRLRGRLGADADQVQFANMEETGRNPARIIPAWRQFATAKAAPGRALRGVGEPIWAGRSAAELVECQTHESLLNVAFADSEAFRLLCPYDTAALPAAVIDEARRSHPIVSDGDVQWSSGTYRAEDAAIAGLDKPLSEPPADARELGFDLQMLPSLRRLVTSEAAAAGLTPSRANALALVVSEAAANSVRHGGGSGRLRVWREPDELVCEVRDAGRIHDPLVGRVAPTPRPDGGQGLWLANQLCDLVQIRSFADGVAVRLHMSA
jgi:anti-sigma regulatory factor (Ser/Thr protein kinase)